MNEGRRPVSHTSQKCAEAAEDLLGWRAPGTGTLLRSVANSVRKKCGARLQRACFRWHVGNVPHILSERSNNPGAGHTGYIEGW